MFFWSEEPTDYVHAKLSCTSAIPEESLRATVSKDTIHNLFNSTVKHASIFIDSQIWIQITREIGSEKITFVKNQQRLNKLDSKVNNWRHNFYLITVALIFGRWR
jgi:hypothetical protein